MNDFREKNKSILQILIVTYELAQIKFELEINLTAMNFQMYEFVYKVKILRFRTIEHLNSRKSKKKIRW